MKHNRFAIFVSILLLSTLACNLTGSASTPPAAQPAIDTTKIALELQLTQMSLQLTQSAFEAQKTASAPTQPPAASPTIEQPTMPPTSTMSAPTKIPPTPEPDIDTLIKNAKILLYEDTQRIGLWVQDALNGMGLKYNQIGDRQGDFLGALNSGTRWNLIIIASEHRSGVQGEFWDAILPRVVNDKTALIVEMWYLNRIANGRIKPLTTQCGIEYQRNWAYAESIYFLDSSHPVFSEPNDGFSLINYDPYWDDAGDLIRLLPGSDATLLAGTFQNRKSDYGVMATCFDGRVIFQTFCNHDFHRSDVIQLWQNYVYYTLKNHFLAVR